METPAIINEEWKRARLDKIREKGVDKKLLEQLQILSKTINKGDTRIVKTNCVCIEGNLSARVKIDDKNGDWYCKATYYVHCEDNRNCILFLRDHSLLLYGYFIRPNEYEFIYGDLDIIDPGNCDALLEKYKKGELKLL